MVTNKWPFKQITWGIQTFRNLNARRLGMVKACQV